MNYQKSAQATALNVQAQHEEPRRDAMMSRAEEQGRHEREQQRLNVENEKIQTRCSGADGRVSQAETDRGKMRIEQMKFA